jgi:hypothetical protein
MSDTLHTKTRRVGGRERRGPPRGLRLRPSRAAAADGIPISYSDLLKKINWDVSPNSPQLKGLLCKISTASLKSEGVLLSAVVVNAGGERKGIPGPGFLSSPRNKDSISPTRGDEDGNMRGIFKRLGAERSLVQIQSPRYR